MIISFFLLLRCCSFFVRRANLLRTYLFRFCNEIGRRDYVTDKIFSLDDTYAKTKLWSAEREAPLVYLLLSEEGASTIAKHVEFYVWKGLLTKVTGIKALSDFTSLTEDMLKTALMGYASAAKQGMDDFGKSSFFAVPNIADGNDEITLYVGKVEPVLHYCMGGVKINTDGQVLSRSGGSIIPGLYACGEVTGGIHGENRLAGNSLLECTVYGRIIGEKISRCANSKI